MDDFEVPMAHYEALSEWNFRILKDLAYCFYDIVRPEASANKTFIVYFLQKTFGLSLSTIMTQV